VCLCGDVSVCLCAYALFEEVQCEHQTAATIVSAAVTAACGSYTSPLLGLLLLDLREFISSVHERDLSFSACNTAQSALAKQLYVMWHCCAAQSALLYVML